MLGRVKNKLVAVFAAVLLACGGVAIANLANVPEETLDIAPQEFIWVDAETAETVEDAESSDETTGETDAVQTPYLEIYKINLSHGSDTQIVYAVYNENFETTNYEVQLLVWDQLQEAYTIESIENDENYYTVVSDQRTTIGGKSCLVFYAEACPAKCYTEDVFVRAYVNVEGVEYYSEVRKFSVLEYVNLFRLTIEELELKYEQETDEQAKASLAKDIEKKKLTSDMLDAMLVYGGKAQINFGYNENRLADDTYYRVDVENGLLADGFTYGLYNNDETVTLTADTAVDANQKFDRWVDENGVTVSNEETVTIALTGVASNKTYTATYVGDGYTFIDRGTYYDISQFTGNYKDVEIPSEYRGKPVVNIIMNAFRDATAMETLVIPASIESIGSYAFSGCTALKSVSIAEGVVTIGTSAFDGCKKLTSIHIPATVTKILDAYVAPFYGCAALAEITVADGNTAYSAIDGNLYSADGTKLLRYAVAKADTTFVLPDTVTTIGQSAVRNATKLTEVYIPASVTTIETHAIKNLASGAVIYYENGAFTDADRPAGWHANWNIDGYTVSAWER